MADKSSSKIKTTRNEFMKGPSENYDLPIYDYSGKVAYVTGASQGVGRHAAIALARSGASVVCVSRSEFGEETAEMIMNDKPSQEAGGSAIFFQGDVADEAQVKKSVDFTMDTYGALHFGINNAGHSGFNEFLENQTEERFDEVFDVNVKGAFFCMKHQIKAMRQNKPSHRRASGQGTDPNVGEVTHRSGYGRIINVGSAAAYIGVKRVGLYVASKHALMGLTKNAALELADDTDIRVNMFVPGSIKTQNYEFFTEGQLEAKKGLVNLHATRQILLPEDCAATILFMCSEAMFFGVGQSVIIDGGILVH